MEEDKIRARKYKNRGDSELKLLAGVPDPSGFEGDGSSRHYSNAMSLSSTVPPNPFEQSSFHDGSYAACRFIGPTTSYWGVYQCYSGTSIGEMNHTAQYQVYVAT